MLTNCEENYLDIPVHNFIFVQILQSYQQLFCVHSYNLNAQMNVEVRKLDIIMRFQIVLESTCKTKWSIEVHYIVLMMH